MNKSLVNIIFGILAVAGTVMILYLSWLPRPKIGGSFLIPGWLSSWVDGNENSTIRTGVPFVALGVTLVFWCSYQEQFVKSFFIGLLVLTMVLFAAELGQLFIPHRIFDWRDIGWGLAGTIAGLFLGSVAILSAGLLPRGLATRRKR